MIGRAIPAALAACALAGCSVLQPQTMRIDSAAGTYQGVTITYRVDGGQLSEPLTVARINGTQVTRQSVPSSRYPDQSVAQLSIRYPHPDGKADYALAELVVETRKPPGAQAKKTTWQQWVDTFAATARDVLPGVRLSDGVHEAWAMDIAKSDLDRVVAGMVQSGYFANPSQASVGVELAARLDGFQANKHWSREPELDVLMDRIREEGQLVSYVHPVESSRASMAIAAGGRTPARFVSQGDEGPALMPAGPQNNAYSNPPENRAASRTPQYTPPPATYTPPYPQTPYAPSTLPAPPAAPTTLPSYPRSGMPNLLRRPAATPAAGPPQSTAPRSPGLRSAGPQSKQPTNPLAKPNSRWQYPPQYRRQAGQLPGSSRPNAAGPAPGAGAATAPPGAARNVPQQPQQRLPWRRPGTEAQQQSPVVPSANAARTQPAPRSRLQRSPAAAKGQQPSAAGRVQPRYPQPAGNQPPARYPSTPYGSAQNDSPSPYPQTSTPSSDGYPAGIPQPPQLGSRPAGNY